MKAQVKLRLTAIAREFGLSFDLFKPENLIESMVRWMSFFAILVSAYLIFRTILASTILPLDWFFKLSEKLYKDGLFEVAFLAFSIGVIGTTILRVVQPVRYSLKSVKLFTLIFIAFLLEKFYWKDFIFLPFKSFNFDYGWTFALIPLIEGTLRLFYALRLEIDRKNDSILIENQPIILPEEDKIRNSVVASLAFEIKHSHFISSYSIGIVGDWGVGKTSFIKTLEKSLKDSEIIVHFSPWLSLGKNSLLQEFSDSLSERLGKYDGGLVPHLDHYIKSLIKVESNAKTGIVESIDQIFNLDGRSKLSQFDSINRAIERIGKRVIVFVDDLDRLDSDEIVEVLKLIRNTASFSNVIYISCYDKIYLLHALEKFNKRNLSIILDKFFDIEVPIFPITGSDLVSRIDLFFKEHSIASDEIVTIKEFLLLNRLFSQFRDVNRFLTSFDFNYKIYGLRLSLEDFFFFELLKVRFPFLPSLLWHKRSDFFLEEFSPVRISLTKEPRSEFVQLGETALEFYLRAVEKDDFEKYFLRPTDLALIGIILKRLFSGENLHPLAINQPNSFGTYFYYDIPESEFEKVDFNKFIERDTYKNELFFGQPFDAKKETMLIGFLENSEPLNERYSTNSKRLFEFLLFLIEWSKGAINPNVILTVYQSLGGLVKRQEHFGDLLLSPSNSPNILFARTNFVSVIIRMIIYDIKLSETLFLKKDYLVDLNLILFQRYLNASPRFTNQSFDALYLQLLTIDSNAKIVAINKEAFPAFRDFVGKHAEEYLDLTIRSGMRPNYDITFVFEPLTFKIFNSPAAFEKFVFEAKYPPRRKARILEYLHYSRPNKDGAFEFTLEEQQLSSFPSEFINAWRDIRDEVKSKIRVVKTEMLFEIRNSAPTEKGARNDVFYDEIFELRTLQSMFIDIESKVDYWRLGLIFLQEKGFPSLLEGRNMGGEKPYVILQVGEPDTKGMMILPNQLEMKDFFMDVKEGNQVRYMKLQKADKITLMISLQDRKTNTWVVEVLKDRSSPIGSRTYNLSKYKYFAVAGWTEDRPLELDTEIILNQPIP